MALANYSSLGRYSRNCMKIRGGGNQIRRIYKHKRKKRVDAQLSIINHVLLLSLQIRPKFTLVKIRRMSIVIIIKESRKLNMPHLSLYTYTSNFILSYKIKSTYIASPNSTNFHVSLNKKSASCS